MSPVYANYKEGVYMEKDEIVKTMKDRGFSLIAEMRSVNVVTLVFENELEKDDGKKRFPVPKYNCQVVADGHFKFTYVVPHSFNTLESPSCSPFDNYEHFENIRSKFEHQAAVLTKYCNI